MNLSYGIASQQGANAERGIVQIEQDRGLVILAEAIGAGSDGGEVLDRAIEGLSGALSSSVTINPNPGMLVNALMGAYHNTGAKIGQQYPNSGVSITTLLLAGSLVVVGHIGSNRLYALSQDAIDCLTTDHTIEEHAAEFGYQTTGDLFSPMVYSVLGQPDTSPDTMVHQLLPGTSLLLISDGVYRAGAQIMNLGQGDKLVFPLDDEEIQGIIRGSSDSQDACERLVNDARRRSSRESASAILLANAFSFEKE